ncbi:hypothetical protein [Bacillus cereus]|uniref:hypothetical protein n=1 Tax=Bacillus cereus TaxID=1396 RepID=UPI003D955065
MIKSDVWVVSQGARITGNSLIIPNGTNGILRQNLPLESYSTYSMNFNVNGFGKVTIRNSREVLFEKNYPQLSPKDISEKFTTAANNTGLYVELSRSTSGGVINFRNFSIK